MSLVTLELDKLMQQNSISELRNCPEYVKLCEAHAIGLESVQKVINYLSDAINVDKAEGIWLDYIGWLLGTDRQYMNIARFFSANEDDINREKYFWFANQNIGQIASLQDELFRRRIYGKIGYNTSKGTRNENIEIIKNITFADHVIIKNISPMVLDITIYGDNILETNTLLDDIELVLGDGVGINRLQIRSLNEWTSQ